MQYINIINDATNSHIIGSITLSKNIDDLRYLYIYQNNIRYDIKLDIT